MYYFMKCDKTPFLHHVKVMHGDIYKKKKRKNKY